jgi:hypothetical protein
MSAGSGTIPPPLPRPRNREWQVFLFVLVGIALAAAITIASLAYFLKPKAQPAETIAAPVKINPNAPIIATDLYIGADDFVVDVFQNGHRVPESARTMSTEVFGAIGEHTKVTVRAGDWLVFNVANNRLRWGGAYYFGVAGVREDGSLAFVSEESPQWSVCEDPGLAPRFIAEPDFFATNRAQRIASPWAGGDNMITAKVQNWNGYAIWGSPTNRNIWLKYRVPSGN